MSLFAKAVVKNKCWIVEEQKQPYVDNVVINPAVALPTTNVLSGPNWQANYSYNTSAYKLASTLNNDTIAYYEYTGLPSDTEAEIASYNYTMTPFTYDRLGGPAGWTAKSIWEVETEKNESKREIQLLKPAYINNFKQQIRDLFDNG
jgi:hypothetical protein